MNEKMTSSSLGSQMTILIVSSVMPGVGSPGVAGTIAVHSGAKKNGMATLPVSVSQVSGNCASRLGSSWAMLQVTTPSG